MTTPALTLQQSALIIAAACRRPVITARRLEQRRAEARLARDLPAQGARVAGTSEARRDRSTGDPCRAPDPGSAANQKQEGVSVARL